MQTCFWHDPCWTLTYVEGGEEEARVGGSRPGGGRVGTGETWDRAPESRD